MEWRDIPDTNAMYQASYCGQIRSLKRREPKILVQSKDKDGYGLVTINGCNMKRTQKAHRLIALAWIPNPDNLPFINHKDEDKFNNAVPNLEWCTEQENTEYSQSKTYKLVSPSGAIIDVFNLRKFCRENNLDQGNMNKVISGLNSQHKGYRLFNGGL